MSQTWMMWLDGDSGQSPEEVVIKAIEYYQEKYGQRPNQLQAPLDFPEVNISGVHIERTRKLLQGHLYLTVDHKASVQEGNGKHAR